MSEVIRVLAVIAIIGYVIGRQLMGESLRGKRVVLLPVILAVAGAVDLGKHGRHVEPADVVFLVISGLIAVTIGLLQGRMIRLEDRNGALWGQMPVRALWLWALLVGSRVIMTVIALAVGAKVAGSSAPIIMLLGINRLGQAAIVMRHALAPAFEYRRVSDGSLQHFAPGNDHPALLAFVNPTCLACDQLVDAMSGAHDRGELNALRVLLVTSDPVSYIEISDSFKDTPLEIGQVTTRATLNSYQAVATPLIVSIGASGHISASGTTTELAELRNFVHACLDPPQINHFSRELPLTEVNARTSRPESSSPRSQKEGADNVI